MQFRHKTFTIYNKTTLYYIKTIMSNTKPLTLCKC